MISKNSLFTGKPTLIILTSGNDIRHREGVKHVPAETMLNVWQKMLD